MKRADDPSQEEVGGLRIVGGVLGYLLGPSLTGSAVLGIFLGVTLGSYLAFLEGRRGAMLREAGWRGLYSGFLPRLLAAVPRSVCTVLAYERAIAFCKRDKT